MQPALKKIAATLLLIALFCPIPYAQDETDFAPLSITPIVQEGAWWMPRHEAKLKRMREGNVDLLMIGDSITHGWEIGGKDTWAEYYGDRNAANIGFSGDRTEHVLWRLQHGEVEGIAPKLAVIMIGTNNTGHRQDPAADTALGIQHIIDELQTRLPETKILLLAIFPRGETLDDPLRKLNTAINERIAKFADNRRVFFLDINPHFLEDDGTLPRTIMADLLHPGPGGYKIWAEAMEPTIAKLLGE